LQVIKSLRISVDTDLGDQVVQAGVAAVRDAFEPMQYAALVNVLPCQSHQVVLRRWKLNAP
jgi:hypothetical protein